MSPLHGLCLQQTEPLSNIYKGLICGSPLSNQEASHFKRLGLYHLIVVSGAHLVFLEKMINALLRTTSYLKYTLLFTYASTCQWNPPIARALAHNIFQLCNKRYRLFIPSHLTSLGSGLWILFLFPEWSQSLSLPLSWTASLALSQSKIKIHQCVWVYFLTLPLLLSFATPTPLSILYNLIFAPVFSLFLFPMTIVTFITPGLDEFGTQIWEFIFKASSWLPRASHLQSTQEPPPTIYFWTYLFSLHTIFFLKHKRAR